MYAKKIGSYSIEGVSDQSIKFAWDVAKYSDTGEYMHDVTAINKAAKENGFKEYPGMNYYENLGGRVLRNREGKVSKYDSSKSCREMHLSRCCLKMDAWLYPFTFFIRAE